MKHLISIIDRLKTDCRNYNPPEHCGRFLTTNGTLICTCNELDFSGLPEIGFGRCSDLTLSYCTIYFIDKEITYVMDHQILESLSKTLQSLTIVNTSLPILEPDFAWPKQITALHLSKMNLTSFQIPRVLRNLEVLELDVNNLQTLPDLKQFPNIHTLSFNDNPNLTVTYEDVVNLCNLKEFRADTLLGSNNRTQSLKVYCNCVRLKYWLDKNDIVNNIPQCVYKVPKRTYTATDCELNFQLPNSEGSDPCGREIISYDGPIHKRRPIRLQRYFISFFFALFVIALFTSFAIYYFREYKKKRAQRGSPQQSYTKPPDTGGPQEPNQVSP